MQAVAKATVLSSHEQDMRDRFGARLRELMGRAGLNQISLAKKAGIDRSLLTRLINGERRANSDQVSRLAPALGVSAAELWMQTAAGELSPKSDGPDLEPRQPPNADLHTPPEWGGSVTTDQGRIVGRAIDMIEDEKTRTEAMQACLDVLAHPHELGAGKRRDRARRSE